METYKYTKGDFVMSEKKTKRIVSASDGQEVKETTRARVVKKAAPVGNATGLRIGAIVLWVAAIAFEVLAILVFTGNINLTFLPVTAQLIIALVLDLICVVVGSLLWKKANRIKPASKKNKFKFWLWNNMGVIVAAFAFIPFIIIALTDIHDMVAGKHACGLSGGVGVDIGDGNDLVVHAVEIENAVDHADANAAHLAVVGGSLLGVFLGGEVLGVDVTRSGDVALQHPCNQGLVVQVQHGGRAE